MRVVFLAVIAVSILMSGCSVNPSLDNNIPNYIKEKNDPFEKSSDDIVKLSAYGFETKESVNFDKKENSGFQVFNEKDFEKFFNKLKLKKTNIFLEYNLATEYGIEAVSKSGQNVVYIKSIESIEDKESEVQTTAVNTDIFSYGHNLSYKVTKKEDKKELKINFYISELKELRVVEVDKTNYIEVPEIREFSFDSSLLYQDKIYIIYFDSETVIDSESITAGIFDSEITRTKIYVIKVE